MKQILSGFLAGGFVASMAIVGWTHSPTPQKHPGFDYSDCDWLAPSLETGPRLLEYKEAKRTPSGNWCFYRN